MSRVELGTEREGLLQVLDEDADLGGHPAAGGSHGKDRHCSFKGSQEAENSALSELCGKEPRRRLGDPEMFKDTHSHLFNIASAKHSCGDNALGV